MIEDDDLKVFEKLQIEESDLNEDDLIALTVARKNTLDKFDDLHRQQVQVQQSEKDPSWFGIPWAPAGVAVAVLTVVTLNFYDSDSGLNADFAQVSDTSSATSVEDAAGFEMMFEMMMAENDVDFYQQLAFMEWLDEEGQLVLLEG